MPRAKRRTDQKTPNVVTTERITQYRLVYGDGGEKVTTDLNYVTARASTKHGDVVYQREVTTTISAWEQKADTTP